MTEDQIEQLTIARLRDLGFAYQYGPASGALKTQGRSMSYPEIEYSDLQKM